MKTHLTPFAWCLFADLVLWVLVIAACTSFAGCAADYPVAVSIRGEHGTYSYSAKRGVEIEIHATK